MGRSKHQKVFTNDESTSEVHITLGGGGRVILIYYVPLPGQFLVPGVKVIQDCALGVDGFKVNECLGSLLTWYSLRHPCTFSEVSVWDDHFTTNSLLVRKKHWHVSAVKNISVANVADHGRLSLWMWLISPLRHVSEAQVDFNYTRQNWRSSAGSPESVISRKTNQCFVSVLLSHGYDRLAEHVVYLCHDFVQMRLFPGSKYISSRTF